MLINHPANFPHKSLAFIFSIRIMRALPHLAALVHRFLTYLSRVLKSRLSKKLIKKFWVFRLATMFYAPVNRLPVQRVVLLPALTLGNC